MPHIGKVDLEMLQKLITQQYKLEETQGKQIILFFGRTGAGTSTLISYLLGTTFKKEKRKIIQIDHNLHSPTPQISDGQLTCTLAPQAYKLTDNSYCIDTPGIADVSQPTTDLFIRIALQIAIQNSASIKAINFVVSEMQIETLRGVIFAELARKIFSLYKGDQFRNSLHLFVTKKITQDNIFEVLEFYRDQYRSQASDLEIHQKNINKAKGFREVEVFIENFLSTKNIFIFDPCNYEQRDNVLDQLKKSPSISKSQIGSLIDLNELKQLLNRIAETKSSHLKQLEQILNSMVQNFGLQSQSNKSKIVEIDYKTQQATEKEKPQSPKSQVQCKMGLQVSQLTSKDNEGKKLDDKEDQEKGLHYQSEND